MKLLYRALDITALTAFTLSVGGGRWSNGIRPVKVSVDILMKVKVKVHTLDTAPLRSESPLQKRSGMARVLKGFHSFTCTPTRSSAIGMSHTCLYLASRSCYSFTAP